MSRKRRPLTPAARHHPPQQGFGPLARFVAQRQHVSNRRALLQIAFRLGGQPDVGIEFVIDTGFTGSLTLPPDAVTAMGLPWLAERTANVADNRDVLVAVHAATILWHGAERIVPVLALGRRPLVGTALLDGSYLGVEFTDNGPVAVTPRTAQP